MLSAMLWLENLPLIYNVCSVCCLMFVIVLQEFVLVHLFIFSLISIALATS